MSASNASTKKRRRVEDRDHDEVVWEDFHELARVYPEFAREWEKVKSQHKSLAAAASPEFQVALSRALLHLRFNLYMPSLPVDRLCPPVPNRWAYVRWIQRELLPRIYTPNAYFESRSTPVYRGMDIGTGASCIYPLLFAKTNPEYRLLVGTEVDLTSAESAMANAKANQLDSKIQVLLVPPTKIQSDGVTVALTNDSDGPISCAMRQPSMSSLLLSSTGPCFDFCMTNPPFFDNVEGPGQRNDARDRSPMTTYEGLYPGGEEGFVIDMIRDSLVWRNRIDWYSAMCGKKTSFVRLRKILIHLLGPGHVETMEFGPGHMTRWFLAWTFQRPNIRSPAAKVVGKQDQFEVTITSDAETNVVHEIVRRICEYCNTLPGYDLTYSTTSQFGGGMTVKGISEKTFPLLSTHVDEPEPLPDRLFSGIARDWIPTEFLPAQGHWLVDVHVMPSQASEHTVTVSMECYRHSARGATAIEKIQSQLAGEVCRTNRRWRRILKRQAQATTEHMEVE